MSNTLPMVEKRFHLSAEQVGRLQLLAQHHQLSEDQVIGKALDILFSLADLLNERAERQGRSYLSEEALSRVWDNEEDAAYDKACDIPVLRPTTPGSVSAARTLHPG